jgi:uncharacterized membrane protein YdfJ with MMPL/SSD domain
MIIFGIVLAVLNALWGLVCLYIMGYEFYQGSGYAILFLFVALLAAATTVFALMVAVQRFKAQYQRRTEPVTPPV